MITVALLFSRSPVCNKNEEFLKSPQQYLSSLQRNLSCHSSSFYLQSCLDLKPCFLSFYICFYLLSYIFLLDSGCTFGSLRMWLPFIWVGGEGKRYWRLLVWESRAGKPALDIPADQGGRFSFCIQPSMEPGVEIVEGPCSSLFTSFAQVCVWERTEPFMVFCLFIC